MKKVIALAGNPNAGKTTLFNALTGANQTVGNWPGVTVEHKEGRLKKDKEVTITDLPGIYSLSPYSQEEVVARNYLIDAHPSVIIDIVDGSNLERNLYLTTQLLELGIPVVVAINMMDIVRKRGDVIDTAVLSQELGAKVVEISALKNEGIDNLIAAATANDLARPTYRVDFGKETEAALSEIEQIACAQVPADQKRWHAIKLFERDEKVAEKLALDAAAKQKVEAAIVKAEEALDDESESIVTAKRYDSIELVVEKSAKRANVGKLTTSDKIDRVVTSRLLGLPIFAVVMVLVYYLSISTIGTMATDWVNDNLFGDGFFLGDFTGQTFDEYSTASGDYDSAQAQIEAYQAAAAEAGINVDSPTFEQQAANAGITATIESANEDTGENDVTEVDAASYAEAVALVDEVGEDGVDPYSYGAYVPSIPAAIEAALSGVATSPVLTGLIVDGIIAGVGAMLGFLPQMFVLFVLLALLEGCGYMSRVAFVLDRVFRRFGLSGKSFIPILIGTGCGVPGIMASRTNENVNDRRMTIMTTTFIPCSAKIPVIGLIASAVFGGVWWVAPSAYFLGLATILCTGVIMKKTKFFAGEATPFVMEMPAYHVPTLSYMAHSVWERCWSFIKKAFTILLIATMLIWFLSNFGFVDGAFGMVEDSNSSILAAIGGALSFIFAPLGWSDWRAVSAVIAGFMAKEQIVGTICYQFLAAWVVAFWVFQFGGLIIGEAMFGAGTVVAIALFAGFLFLLLRPNPYAKKRVEDKKGHPQLVGESA